SVISGGSEYPDDRHYPRPPGSTFGGCSDKFQPSRQTDGRHLRLQVVRTDPVSLISRHPFFPAAVSTQMTDTTHAHQAQRSAVVPTSFCHCFLLMNIIAES